MGTRFYPIRTHTRENPYPCTWVQVFMGIFAGTDKGIIPMGMGTDLHI